MEKTAVAGVKFESPRKFLAVKEGVGSVKLELGSNWFYNTRKNSNSKKVGSTTSLHTGVQL